MTEKDSSTGRYKKKKSRKGDKKSRKVYKKKSKKRTKVKKSRRTGRSGGGSSSSAAAGSGGGGGSGGAAGSVVVNFVQPTNGGYIGRASSLNRVADTPRQASEDVVGVGGTNGADALQRAHSETRRNATTIASSDRTMSPPPRPPSVMDAEVARFQQEQQNMWRPVQPVRPSGDSDVSMGNQSEGGFEPRTPPGSPPTARRNDRAGTSKSGDNVPMQDDEPLQEPDEPYKPSSPQSSTSGDNVLYKPSSPPSPQSSTSSDFVRPGQPTIYYPTDRTSSPQSSVSSDNSIVDDSAAATAAAAAAALPTIGDSDDDMGTFIDQNTIKSGPKRIQTPSKGPQDKNMFIKPDATDITFKGGQNIMGGLPLVSRALQNRMKNANENPMRRSRSKERANPYRRNATQDRRIDGDLRRRNTGGLDFQGSSSTGDAGTVQNNQLTIADTPTAFTSSENLKRERRSQDNKDNDIYGAAGDEMRAKIGDARIRPATQGREKVRKGPGYLDYYHD